MFIVFLARRLHSSGEGESLIAMRSGTRFGVAHPLTVIALAGAILAAAVTAGVLLGDRSLLMGDVVNWLRGVAPSVIDIILGSRVPRVFGALLAGACLALAGAFVQAVTRNPLADPGILGVSASAGLGAILAITLTQSSDAVVFIAALVGAGVAALVIAVFGKTDQLRMVLVGIGVSAAASALTTLLLIGTDPWNQTKAMTWLGGSTYGTTTTYLWPMVAALGLTAFVCTRTTRELDLLQFDETTPRVLGVAVDRQRLIHIALAVVLTAVATASIGTIAFVGLVAPHAARMLVGKKHSVLLPLATIVGAILVVVGDVVGRVMLAPAQLPAGLVVSLIGTPYFLWLLHRMRANT